MSASRHSASLHPPRGLFTIVPIVHTWYMYDVTAVQSPLSEGCRRCSGEADEGVVGLDEGGGSVEVVEVRERTGSQVGWFQGRTFSFPGGA